MQNPLVLHAGTSFERAEMARPWTVQQAVFQGAILERGFWLYIWEVTTPEGKLVYYVGRTGDNSSTNAQSPYNRLGQHLGFAKNTNALRKYLVQEGLDPVSCRYRMISLGPLDEESKSAERAEHDARRDKVAAMEKALADALIGAGLRVMNPINCHKPLDREVFDMVWEHFRSVLILGRRNAGTDSS